MPSPRDFWTSQKLKNAREAKGWSQLDLAKAIGVHENTVVRWELGRSRPSPDSVRQLRLVLLDLRPTKGKPYASGGRPKMAWFPEMDRALIATRAKGASWDTVANVVGVSTEVARKRAAELGMNTRRGDIRVNTQQSAQARG